MSYVKFAVMMACSSCSEVVPRGSKNPPKKRLSFYIARQVLQSRLVVLLWWCGFQWQKLSSLFSFWWWPKRPPSKKKRLNKALEAYQAAYAKHKIKRKNEAAWLDGNAEWKQRPGKTKLNENRLRLYALQLDAPRWANHEPQWIKVFQFLPAQHSAKTRRTDFCWHQHSSKWVAWLPTVVSALLLLSKKRLFIPSLQLITTHLSESVKNASPPWLWAITTDPLWSESTTSKKKKKHYQAQWTDLVLFARQPQVWLCWRGNSCCTCLHQAAAHLRVSPTAPASKAPLPLCGIPVALCEFRLTKPKTQPQLILFISTHHTSIHSHSSVSGGIYTPSSAALYWSQGS